MALPGHDFGSCSVPFHINLEISQMVQNEKMPIVDAYIGDSALHSVAMLQ